MDVPTEIIVNSDKFNQSPVIRPDNIFRFRFCQQSITVAESADRYYIPLIQVCDALGIDMETELVKLQPGQYLFQGLQWMKIPLVSRYGYLLPEKLLCLEVSLIPVFLATVDQKRVLNPEYQFTLKTILTAMSSKLAELIEMARL